MINIAMWGRALKIIPKIDRQDWDRMDLIARWLIATRAAVFVMTAVSCGIGGLLAYRDGAFSWLYFGACFVGLVFAHATNNLINDYTDHIKGVDKDNYFRSQYGPQPLEHGLLSKGQLAVYIVVTGLIALAAGAVLVYETGTITLTLLGIGAFFVLFYTWPLKYIGLGEVAVILVWGPLMVGGTYYVVSSGQWNYGVIVMSLAYALGPTTVLFGKHTDKLEQDQAKKIRTLPVLLGESASRYSVIAMWIMQYFLIAGLVIHGSFGWSMLLVFLAIPSFRIAAKTYLKPRPAEKPDDFPEEGWPLYLVAYAFLYNRRFGFLFLGGLIFDVFFKKFGVY